MEVLCIVTVQGGGAVFDNTHSKDSGATTALTSMKQECASVMECLKLSVPFTHKLCMEQV